MALVLMVDSSEDGDGERDGESEGSGLAGADFRRVGGAVVLVGFL